MSSARILAILLLAVCWPASTTVASPQALDLGLGGKPERHVTWKVAVVPDKVQPGGRIEVVASYKNPKGWHVYAPDHKGTGIATKLEADLPLLKAQGDPKFPPPEVKEVVIVETEIHRLLPPEGEIRQSYVLGKEATPGELPFKALLSYMACSDNKCDLPTFKEPYSLTLQVEAASAATKTTKPLPTRSDTSPVEASSPGAPTDDLLTKSIWVFLGLMIGGGLLALIMPCTYPMIPITIGYFTNLAASRKGGVLHLALAYGAGIILSFNIIGWVFASSIRDFSSNAWVNLVFGIAFLAFALSFLGLYNLTLPASVNNLASRASGASSFLGVFALGATLVVTSFACTGPIMGALLVVAGTGESLGRVTAGMTAFGATMAAPFVLLALFPARARSIPRAGEWMHTIKVFLGFVLLTTCLIFFSKADSVWGLGWLPREPFLLIWAAIFAALGLYLLGLFRLKNEEAGGIGAFRMLLGITCVAAALYFHLGTRGFRLDWITESMAPSYSLSRLQAAAPPRGSPESWPIVKDDLDKGLALAKAKGLKALVNFTGFA